MDTNGLRRPILVSAVVALALAGAGAVPAAPRELEPMRLEPSLASYLPAGVDYDPEIPPPSDVLGFEVGEWHVRHDQLVRYFEVLAERSERMRLEVTGHTYERRPLLLAIVSAPGNLARLDETLTRHRALSDPRAPAPDTAEMPVVVNLGYSVHGNEASGANAALLVAYHLAAARGPEIDRLLERAVVLVDPSLNPDGLARFAQWANMHRGRVPVADPDHREHREGWPNGRTNHYWFDLNRDWLPARHPETRARLAAFHRFRPNVLLDVHEMGSDSTYFFQPGVPSRKNPLTPARNVELTAELTAGVARALDELGSLYYTEETFDDFYYGKGSTYPDVQGAVGILFEQASVRGHRRESDNGELSFPFAIRNQLRASLAVLEAAVERRRALLDYQAAFYRDAWARAADDDLAGWIVGDPEAPGRTRELVTLLRRHRIEVNELARRVEAGGETFEPASVYFVPTRQPQYLLARSLFERRVDFPDTTFYDVSAWTLPLAFDLPFAEIRRDDLRPGLVPDPPASAAAVEPGAEPGAELGSAAAVEPGAEPDAEQPRAAAVAPPPADAYAYAFSWGGEDAPRALHALLAAGIRARVATRSFFAPAAGGRRELEVGTIVVPAGIQTVAAETLHAALAALARDGVEIHALDTGLTPGGIDLGSPSLEPLTLPRVAVAVGEGINPYAAGAIWHLLDRRYRMPVSLVERDALAGLDLSRYTHLVLVDGDYDEARKKLGRELGRWVRRGGVLIATQRAIPWVDEAVAERDETAGDEDAPASASRLGDEPPDEPLARRPYDAYEKDRAERLISGAIFRVELDLTHPLAYGYRRPALAVFRNHEIVLEPPRDPYSSVAVYAEAPLYAGYVSAENLVRLAGTPAVTAHRAGDGVVVRIVDDPNFRAFWLGTQRLFANAIFFAPILDDTSNGSRRGAS